MTRVCQVYDMCRTCLWHVLDMCMTCVWHVYDMSMTCLWHRTVCACHDICQANHWTEQLIRLCVQWWCMWRHTLSHTHTWIVIQHMLASPHTAHTNAYSPTSRNQACKAIKESVNNSHHTTYNNNHGHCKLSGASLALFLARNPQIARRHMAES